MKTLTLSLVLVASVAHADVLLCPFMPYGPVPNPGTASARHCGKVANRICRLCGRQQWGGTAFCTAACRITESTQPCYPPAPTERQCCAAGYDVPQTCHNESTCLNVYPTPGDHVCCHESVTGGIFCPPLVP